MAKLICTAGPNIGDQWDVHPGLTTIGRKGNNNVVLHDAKVSRNHATLKFEANKYTLEDLGSLNSTLVFGKRITRIVIAPETHIQIGNSTLLLTRKNAKEVGLEFVEAVGEELMVKHKDKRAVMAEILHDLDEAKAHPAKVKKKFLGQFWTDPKKPAHPSKKKGLD